MWMVIIGVYTLLTVMAFWVANSENSKATKAQESAERAEIAAESAQKEVSKLRDELRVSSEKSDADYKRIVEVMLTNDAHGEKLKQKMEWVEMKLNNQPKVQALQKLVISQEKPLQFNVVYRPSVKKKPLTEAQSRKVLIESTKKKIKELSQ